MAAFLFLADPASVHTVRWAEGLRRRGHTVEIVPSHEGMAPGARTLTSWLRRRWHLRRAMRRSGAVLVIQYVPAGVRALAMLGLHPRIAVAWGSDIHATQARRGTVRGTLAAIQQRALLRGCDAVVAPSQDLVRAAIAAGAEASRTRYVPFGVDLRAFRPGLPDPALRARLDVLGRRVVLSNRTIAPLYHQMTVVEALDLLPSDVVVVMTRQRASQSEIARVEARACELGLADRLRLIDPVGESELPGLYRLADVVVSLAGSDGGPVTVLEAMASGKPIVASDLPAVREWLGSVDPTALVPPDDAAAVASAIRRALALTPREREELSSRERAVAEARADREEALTVMETLHSALSAVRGGVSPWL